ncbi:nuclear transport factor 2 family protein [Mucilaginibacter gynuensis]
MKRYTTILLLLLAGTTLTASAQSTKKAASKSLYSKIIALDKEVFDAYNKCDLDKFEDYYDSDVEFFNDRTGYTESRHDLMKSMKSVCENGGMMRQLVSAKVYQLDFYGAMEMGEHRFYKMVNGKKEPQGSASFITIWKQKDDKWKITRVISYNHKD